MSDITSIESTSANSAIANKTEAGEQATTNTDTISTISSAIDPATLLQKEIEQVNYFSNLVIEFFSNYTFQLIGAFIIFLLGYMLAGKVSKMVLRLCERNQLDITLSQFLASTSKMLVVILITVVALGKLGVSITPFIAAIGAISLGAGLALQGLLSNYAAGFNIILIRPFVVGDTIKVMDVTGVVTEVLLAYTILTDEDGVKITIPNKHIVGEVLQNSNEDSLLDLSVGIAYAHNPVEVVALLEKVIADLDIVSDAKTPQIGISEFADSSINIQIRLWTQTKSLYASKFLANKAIYQALEENNIKIPFPQRDVHLIKDLS